MDKSEKINQLDSMFEVQLTFEEMFLRNKTGLNLDDIRKNPEVLLKWNKEFILALMKESSELLDGIDWKTHSEKNEEELRDNFLENSIDVMKYLFALYTINGYSAEDIYDKFISKSHVVAEKYQQEDVLTRIKSCKAMRLAIIDIDGVLSDYPKSFLEMVNVDPPYHNYSSVPELRECNFKLYEDMKHKYRTTGVKKTLKVKPGAMNFLNKLYDQEIVIVLLTARPYRHYLRIYHDTITWLKENNLVYDAIIWESRKAAYAVKHLANHEVVLCIDDEMNNANDLAKVFKNVHLMINNQLYRNGEDCLSKVMNRLDHKIKVVRSFDEIKL